MRLQHIIQAVFGEPWLISEQGHAAIVRTLEAHLPELAKLGLGDPEMKRPDGSGYCGMAVASPQMTIENGVAIIPVGGVLASKITAIERGGGAVDYRDIINDLREAVEDSEVDRIVLDVDSPGGTVLGCEECYQAVRAAADEKHLIAFTAGKMCSAALKISLPAHEIVATPSAAVGSVGVFSAFTDYSEMAKKLGINVEVFTSGKYKGMGLAGTSLSTAQRVHLQDQVDTLANEFKAQVLEHRYSVRPEAMEGQVFSGSRAISAGYVDSLANSIEDMLERI